MVKEKRLIGKLVFVSLNILLAIFGIVASLLSLLGPDLLPSLIFIIFLYLTSKLYNFNNRARKIILWLIIPVTIIFYLQVARGYTPHGYYMRYKSALPCDWICLKNRLLLFLPFLFYCAAFIIYFTRPKVKEQFK